MKVDIAELREVATKLFDHLEKSGIRSFELVHDHYWEVPAGAR